VADGVDRGEAGGGGRGSGGAVRLVTLNASPCHPERGEGDHAGTVPFAALRVTSVSLEIRESLVDDYSGKSRFAEAVMSLSDGQGPPSTPARASESHPLPAVMT
jgi:hypothetical protein